MNDTTLKRPAAGTTLTQPYVYVSERMNHTPISQSDSNTTFGTSDNPEQSVHSCDVDVDLHFNLDNPNVALNQMENVRKLMPS